MMPRLLSDDRIRQLIGLSQKVDVTTADGKEPACRSARRFSVPPTYKIHFHRTAGPVSGKCQAFPTLFDEAGRRILRHLARVVGVQRLERFDRFENVARGGRGFQAQDFQEGGSITANL
jgi:hypothetical protein